jgi:hypothetical protein
MESLTSGELRIDVSETSDPALIKLFWTGKSREQQPRKTLLPFFSSALTRAAAHGAALELHFEKLEYFNSSTITCIIHLIQDARSRSVKVVIVFNPAHKWQKLSFEALRAFAKADGLLELRASEGRSEDPNAG